MKNNSVFDIKRLFAAFNNSVSGLRNVFKTEVSFRQELLVCVILLPLALYLGRSAIDKVLLISSILLILIVELINSAIETVIDRISADSHELSGRAKDIGSAGVFLAIINAVIVWILIIF